MIKAKDLIASMIEQSGLQQNEVAEKTNLTPVTINRYVKGLREPTYDNLVKVAEACGFEMRWRKTKSAVDDLGFNPWQE